MTTTMNQAAAAFVKAQAAFAPALKSSSNPHFKTKYADLAACVEAVVDALNSNGLAVMQRPAPSERGVKVRTVFLHESGAELDGGEIEVPAAKQDPQGYGSALTYARRYGLMAACGIAPEDDDANAGTQAVRDRQQQRPAARQQPQQDKGGQTMAQQVHRIVTDVKAGNAKQPAEWLASLDEAALNAIWKHIPAETQDELTAVWPEAATEGAAA
jgi:hypothetical protein